MMNKTVSFTKEAPEPIGPYSQAIKTGNLVFVSGQIAINPETGMLLNGSIQEETHQVMKNLTAVLKASGTGLENVVKTTIYLKNMDDFKEVNAVYGSYFKSDYPARETVQVARLPKDANVEISVIATCKNP